MKIEVVILESRETLVKFFSSGLPPIYYLQHKFLKTGVILKILCTKLTEETNRR